MYFDFIGTVCPIQSLDSKLALHISRLPFYVPFLSPKSVVIILYSGEKRWQKKYQEDGQKSAQIDAPAEKKIFGWAENAADRESVINCQSRTRPHSLRKGETY